MTIDLSNDVWVAVLLFINFFILIFLFTVVRKINRIPLKEDNAEKRTERSISADDQKEVTRAHAEKITQILRPLVEDSRQTAISFESQIKEKKRLIKELNEALDSRIISINLLLSRADAQLRKLEERRELIRRDQQRATDSFAAQPPSHMVDDQQHQILELYYQNVEIDTIAKKLSIPEGEVRLVIDLKERFAAMENNSQ